MMEQSAKLFDLALRRMCKRRLSLAWQSWLSRVRLQHEADLQAALNSPLRRVQVVMAAATRGWCTRMLAKSVRTWRVRVLELQQQEHFMLRMVTRMQQRRVSSAWRSWEIVTRHNLIKPCDATVRSDAYAKDLGIAEGSAGIRY